MTQENFNEILLYMEADIRKEDTVMRQFHPKLSLLR